MSEAITNVIQLRQYLAERLPQLRICTESSLAGTRASTALPELDGLLGGEICKSAITELVSPRFGSGSALALSALLRQAHAARQWIALVDAHDSFDPVALRNEVFPRFIWVRCRDAKQALQATDLLLRDGNLSLLVLDLRMSSAVECRKIPPTTWHRFLRLIEPIRTALLAITPRTMVSCSRARLQMRCAFGFEALDQPERELLNALRRPRFERDAVEGDECLAQAG